MTAHASHDVVRRHQDQLLLVMHEFFDRRGRTIGPHVRDAFLAVPRHLFVERYKIYGAPEWHEVTAVNLADHLATLYHDDGVGILDDGRQFATMSRPALVLFML